MTESLPVVASGDRSCRTARAVAILAVLTLSSVGVLRGQTLSPEEMHDRLVAVLHDNAHRAVVAGDTFVTWSPRPVLYTTARLCPESVSSSLVRADAMVGTAEVVWRDSVPVEGQIQWTRPDSLLLDLTFEAGNALVIRRNGVVDTLPLPEGFWAVADYGMEDQLLPIIMNFSRDGESHLLHVYRPYPMKWDRLSVKVESVSGGLRAEIVDTDGETWWWVMSNDGSLVAIRRSEHSDYERSPLINTFRYSDYLRLRDYARP